MGKPRHPEYASWYAMIDRCENPANRQYPGYGGRGIRVCAKWKNSLAAFLADMGPRPSPAHQLDRIDNNKGYCPNNCRWATRKTNARNRRDSTAVTARGKTQTVAAWAEELGVPAWAIHQRLKRGWSHSEALGFARRKPTRTAHRTLTHAGKTQSMQAWARETGIALKVISSRINSLGWSVKQALTTPCRKVRPAGF